MKAKKLLEARGQAQQGGRNWTEQVKGSGWQKAVDLPFPSQCSSGTSTIFIHCAERIEGTY